MSSQTRSQVNKAKAAVSAATAAVPAPAPVDLARVPVAPPVELAPLQPPNVEWDGKLLSINAENASLGDILTAIHIRTGASVEMPPSASSERVFVQLGPAPIREVISSLLYGTNFDYVIQASETDEDGLRSVILTARGGGDLGNMSTESLKAAGVRLMPGYAAPGKRTFEVMNQNVDSDNGTSSASSESSSPETTAPAAETPAAGTESASTTTPNPDAQPTTAQPEPDAASGLGLSGGNPLTTRPLGVSAAEASASSSSSLPQMVQELQRMYQQRRQIQAQQNQAAAQAPTTNN